MVLSTKEAILKEKRTAMESFNGPMGLPTMENFCSIIFTEKESINGLMEENMMAIGKIIRWREEDSLFGMMGESTKANT
mgnify:CR=1 FL=1